MVRSVIKKQFVQCAAGTSRTVPILKIKKISISIYITGMVQKPDGAFPKTEQVLSRPRSNNLWCSTVSGYVNSFARIFHG